MKAIIMAGGFGTRLRPLTINVPKPMVPIIGIPIMEHVVSLLKKHGITEITSLLYFQPEHIKSHFGNGSRFGVTMRYVVPDEDYGTAGAVRFALDRVDEPVLIISGDLITTFDLTAAIGWHRERQAQATLLLTRKENPLAFGIVITDKDGRIVRFLEKPSWGEAFSDTINTGIYILEPGAIQLIPPRTDFDFSQNLFPLMLSKGMALYGRETEGYWRDIGNVDEYQEVHVDFFDGRLVLDAAYEVVENTGSRLFKAPSAQIAADARITGRVVVCDNARVGSGVSLTNCIIGHSTVIDPGCEINGTVIWADNRIGAESNLSSSIICRGSRIGKNVQFMDKVIVSDDCRIGDSATIKANCKIWPGKTVDEGAIVSSSMVWGEKWNRELFAASKITGLALSELTPEMAVKVGAAFGAFLPRKGSVLVSRDGSDISRLLKRGLISGLLAAGSNVFDIEMMPVPIVRYSLQQGNYNAAIYVRHDPDDFRRIDMIFFDGSGLDLPNAKAKKIERLYFGEDFQRASLDEIGHLEYPQHAIESYREEFLRNIDVDLIRSAGFKIVVDHSNGSSSTIFPTLFTHLGISTTELNANLNPRKFSISPAEAEQALVQMSAIVTSLHADVGFILNTAAEKLSVIDEDGRPIDNQTLLLIVTDLYLRTNKSKKIAVPVGASMGVEQVAAEYGIEVVRVANDHLAMMEIYRRGDVDFVGGTRGGFIFPGFQMGADGMFASVKILEMLARTRSRLGDIRGRFEQFSRKAVSVPCPWSRKGTVMRQLIINSEGKDRQLIDGVRIFEDGGWVLVTPDRTTASFSVFAEASRSDEAEALVDVYRRNIETYQAD